MHNEGPVDIIFLTITEWITPFFHATGHTPNMITTYSLICGLAAVYCLWKGYLVAFVSLFLDQRAFQTGTLSKNEDLKCLHLCLSEWLIVKATERALIR